MRNFIRGRTERVESKILKVFLYFISRAIARRNIEKNPQLVIFSFDHIGLTLNLEGRYENSSLLLVEEFIKQKMPNAKEKIALDIGANIGNHSIFFGNEFKIVYAFEPNPIAYEVLKINCKFSSDYNNIVPVNIGLSNKKASLPFCISRSNMGSSHIINNDEKLNNKFTQIDVVPLDQLNELKNANVGLIKIDVEGHELSVLKGGEILISKNMPVILFEQHPSEILNGTSQVIQYLESMGYEFFVIKKNFYFGENIYLKLLSLFFRTLFGERLDFVEIKEFKKLFYNMILAMPKSTL